MSTSGRVKTGVPGLDDLLGGGIPEGRVVLIVGGPGAGKTILGTQFLVNGIAQQGENGLFVSLDEPKHLVYKEMAAFGWNLADFERQKKFAFLDASPIRHLPGEVKIGKLAIGKREFSLLSLIEGIQSNAKTIVAKRILVDPMSSLIFQYPDAIARRTAILDLLEALVATGATSVLTTELRAPGLERAVQLEEYLAHGVLVLQTAQMGRNLVRSIQVEKMRETAIDMQPRPYQIGPRGIEVFPKESIY